MHARKLPNTPDGASSAPLVGSRRTGAAPSAPRRKERWFLLAAARKDASRIVATRPTLFHPNMCRTCLEFRCGSRHGGQNVPIYMRKLTAQEQAVCYGKVSAVR